MSPSMTAACPRCGESLVNPEMRCQSCIGERREEAVKILIAAAKSTSDAPAEARVGATNTLRNLGHSNEQVLLARARALDGHSVAEIVDGLAGVERGAVAA